MKTATEVELPIGLNGTLRRHIYVLLETPRTGRILLNQLAAMEFTMSYQDLRHTLRDFEQRGWIRCLNADELTGRIYVQKGTTVETRNWWLIARLCRGHNRIEVLHEMAALCSCDSKGRSASAIRRGLKGRSKMALGHVLRALEFLETNQLVECVGHTRKGSMKCYRATEEGLRLSDFVSKMERIKP